ncbi:hypothetical protein [Methylomonas albis]|uniref:DNA primase n=1 Tax=Methylomonas albis TaxID=1854563 RepID=A0ABR9CZN6_9GAMM|nr:hypothetical protein [Methylomonas albis]MBD9356339.1 hypothetical protein [Methylomonas albis]
MNDKSFGKLTGEQLDRINTLVKHFRVKVPEVEQAYRGIDQNELDSMLGSDFSWSHLYELPLDEHVAACAFVFDLQDMLKQAAQAKDPQQFILDYFDNLNSDDWNDGYQGRFLKQHLIAAVMSIIKTMKSIMIYQKSLSTLIEEVRQGKDKSLFEAISIDRSVMACMPVRRRISIAEMKSDHKFFNVLNKATKGPSGKIWIHHEPLRFVMSVLVDCGANNLSSEQLETLFVNRLGLYNKQPSARKNISELFLKTKKYK